jgi:RimJ/RimL family protein N-acetyltransferase
MGDAVIWLRDVVESDLPIFFEHQRDPEAIAMAQFPSREHGAFMEHWHTKVLGNPSTRTKTILVDGDVAGYLGSWEADGERVVGYSIGRTYWGRGIATAALAAFVADHETQRPLLAHVAVQNVRSLRVAEKCGFRRVGEPAAASDGVLEVRMALTEAVPVGNRR